MTVKNMSNNYKFLQNITQMTYMTQTYGLDTLII
jgi:hypothetical protein